MEVWLLLIAFLFSPRPGKTTVVFFHDPNFSPFAYPLHFLPPERYADTPRIPPFLLFNFWILPSLMLRQSQSSRSFFFYCCLHFSLICGHGQSSELVLSDFSACHLNFFPPPAVLSPLVLLILPCLLYHTVLPPPVH